MATALADWSAQDVAVSDVLRRLGALRQAEGGPELRTNVMTHMAWAPPRWEEAAQQVLEGLAERHPSRTILLVPAPDEPNGIDARVSVLTFPIEGSERRVSTEVPVGVQVPLTSR